MAQLTMLGADLYLAQAAAVTKIANVASCAGACGASAVTALAAITAPLSLAADSAAGRLYIGDATGIVRFTVASAAMDVYANTSTTGTAFSNVSGLVFRPATLTTPAALFGLDDTTAGASPFTGRAWQMAVLV